MMDWMHLLIIEGYGITLQGHLALPFCAIAFIHVNEMTLIKSHYSHK